MKYLGRPCADKLAVLRYMDDCRRSIDVRMPTCEEPPHSVRGGVAAREEAPSLSSRNWFEIQLFDPTELKRTLDLYDAKEGRARAFLATVAKKPATRSLHAPPDLDAIRALSIRFPNFTRVIDLVESMAALSHAPPRSPLVLPPLLLAGAPGIGKTAFAMALAEVLGLEWSVFGMAHSTASFDLGGLDPGYGNGGPGLLTRQLALGEHADRFVILDELDKTPRDRNSDPLGPLLELLEPATAARFMDEGIKVCMDMSYLQWLATANDIDQIDAPLRSRFAVFEIAPPTTAQATAIVRSIYKDLLQGSAWGVHFSAHLDPEVINALSSRTPRDAKSSLLLACGRARRDGRNYLTVLDLDPPAASTRRIGFI